MLLPFRNDVAVGEGAARMPQVVTLGDLVGRLERHLHPVSREQIVVVRYKELVRHAEAAMRSLGWPAKTA
jgi:hypothetical protein